MDLPNKSEPSVPHVPNKNIKQIVSGTVEVKRPATKRFMNFVFAESPKQLSKKVGHEVIVPRLKAALEEAFNSFLSGMLWHGGSRPFSGMVGQTMIRGGGTNYQQISSSPLSGMQQARGALPAQQQSGNYVDLVCPTQQQAEVLLAGMYDLLNQYRIVAVADLHELAGITPAISAGSYGWTSLDGARIYHVPNGYLLELPRPSII